MYSILFRFEKSSRVCNPKKEKKICLSVCLSAVCGSEDSPITKVGGSLSRKLPNCWNTEFLKIEPKNPFIWCYFWVLITGTSFILSCFPTLHYFFMPLQCNGFLLLLFSSCKALCKVTWQDIELHNEFHPQMKLIYGWNSRVLLLYCLTHAWWTERLYSFNSLGNPSIF